MAEPSLKFWVEVMGLPIVGVAAKAAFDWWRERQAKAGRESAEFLRAAAELHEKLSEGGGELLEEFRKEFRFLRGEVVRLTGELAEANRKLSLKEQAEAECQRLVSALRLELDDRLGRLPLTPPHEF